jgi:hypothetical protein
MVVRSVLDISSLPIQGRRCRGTESLPPAQRLVPPLPIIGLEGVKLFPIRSDPFAGRRGCLAMSSVARATSTKPTTPMTTEEHGLAISLIRLQSNELRPGFDERYSALVRDPNDA